MFNCSMATILFKVISYKTEIKYVHFEAQGLRVDRSSRPRVPMMHAYISTLCLIDLNSLAKVNNNVIIP